MAKKLSNAFISVRESVSGAVSAHPAVFTILCYTSLVMILDFELPDVGKWGYPIATAPVFIALALAVDYLFHAKWLSWIVPVLMGLTVLIPGIEDWGDGSGFIVTTFIITPLLFLLSRRTISNESFVRNGVWTVCSAVLSLALASILALALFGILVSAEALFGADIDLSVEISTVVCFVLISPMLFVGFSERENIPSISRVLEIIVNWILSPVIIIYTAMLFLYMGKILITWNLPCGGVAVMCLAWGIIMTVIAAVQPLLSRHPYKWLAESCGYLAMPMIAMLWVAIIRRVAQYGITPDRYFLVVSGITMTVAFAITLLKVRNGYFKIAAIAAALFTVGLTAPVVNYRSVTAWSQENRAENACNEVGMTEGRDEEIALFPSEKSGKTDIDGFTAISLDLPLPIASSKDGRQYFEVEGTQVYIDEMIAQQLKKIGATDDSPSNLINENADEFLVYETSGFTIFFKRMYLTRSSRGGYTIPEDKIYTSAILYR